ncbi:MAG: lipoprotein signal peptidase [Bacteroidales bacterium]|jgi:signal peptidase II|nr:lipoprotein signal peptidase [Bacteroidales bacterium]MCI1733851.1 lipoprotein signal peptidase [Bacteroidales bacterium]
MTDKNKKWIIAGLVVLLLFIDQAIKFYVKLHMMVGESIPMFGTSQWAQILFIENNGMAFGMQLGGIAGKLFLSLFRLVLIGLIIWYLNVLITKKKAPWGVLIGGTLILMGAIGNMIDSTFYGKIFSQSSYTNVASLVPFGNGYAPLLCGKVVDMFYFPVYHTVLPSWFPFWGGQDFEFFRPIFNFSDACITCGVLYLIIFQYKFFSTQPASASDSKPEEKKEEE